MIQEIDFKGLSFSPSDQESDDGEMGCMVNLLNEDGALKAITLSDGEVVGEIPSHCRIVKAHKNNAYSHWILDCVEDDVHTWKWTQMDGTGGGEFDLPEGFEPKSVSAIGNMVCFVGSDETAYALWKDGAYVMFSMQDFNYSVMIKNCGKTKPYNPSQHSFPERDNTSIKAEIGDIFTGCFIGDPIGDDTDDEGFPEKVARVSVSKSGSKELWSALDAYLNKFLESFPDNERYLKHITLGMAAVRLFDESLINVSDIFVLAPMGKETIPNKVNVDRADKSASMYMDYHTHIINVIMPAASRLGDIVQGVDIYLTTGDRYLDTDNSYEVTLDGTRGTSGNFAGSFEWDCLKGEKLYEAIDREVFCLSKTVKPSELGTDIYLERVTGAEDAMTLSDFRRSDIGGEYSYGYNNRLHIASVRQGVGSPMVPRIYVTSTDPNPLQDNGRHFGELVEGNFILQLDIVMEVSGVMNGQSYTHYFKVQSAGYPFGPIVCVPHVGAKTMTMYMKVSSSFASDYYKKQITLHGSDSWGCAYYVDVGTYGMHFLQSKNYDMYQQGWIARPDWEASDLAEFGEKWAMVNPEWPVQENVIKVSEVDNPLVFPVGNTVRVGAGKILGLATNTEPISEGQFGVAPLYAFTDEGVWPLSVSDTGTYSSLGQPSSRDVVTDAGSITPIDKGVLFATKRGVMIIRGNQTESLTDSLNGIPWDFTTLPHHDTLLNAFDASIVGYQRMEDFMPGSRMIYDYVRERVYLYRDDYDYALVLSLRTGLWGAAEKGGLQGGVPWYPETYILRDIDGKREIVNTSAPSDPTRKVDVLCCTRPLSLGAREIHKSVMHAVVRGLAHMRGSGEASRLGCAIYGSNDLYHWFAVNSSTNQYLRGRYGQPYKWWRIAIVGSMDEAETIDGVTMDVKARLNNRLR